MEKKSECENRVIQRSKEHLNWIDQRLIDLEKEKCDCLLILEKFGIA